MAQNLLDRLDESIGMEEHDLGRDISDAAMRRGISPVEMRAQIIKQMLEAEGRTISDEDLALFATGEITLSDVMGRTPSDTDAWTDQAQAPFQAPSLKELYDSSGEMLDRILGPNPDSPITGHYPKYQRFKEINRNYNPVILGLHGISTLLGKGVGEVMEAVDEVRKGRTLSDLDQVDGWTWEMLGERAKQKKEMDQIQALAADSGRTVSDRSAADVLNMLQEGRTLSDQDLSGRTLSNQDLAIGRTMSDQDLSGRTLSDVDVEAETLSVDEQLSQLHELLNEHRRTLSDADRRFLQEMSWAIGINSYTPSDQDRQIIQDIQGRILSDSDAAIIEMLK